MSSVPTAGERTALSPRRTPWRTAGLVALAGTAFLAVAALLSSDLGLVDMARWAATQQRAFYDLVGKLLQLDKGNPLAGLGLVGACLAYGFAHAAVPGHGKFLIAGAGLASRMTAVRLVLLSLAASLAQAVTAIVLVYGSFAVLDITAGWAMAATDSLLVPLSYVAILAIGLLLVRRAVKGFSAVARAHGWIGGATAPRAHGHHHDPHHACHEGCDHRHAPTLEEVQALRNWRDAAMLIVGIGMRPCTGAIFVLVAAWRLDLLLVGALAAVAMAAGTGAFISLVAVSTVTARGATLLAAGAERAGLMIPLLQLIAGVAIVLVAVAFLVATLLPV
jgi:ABC-type nickel/cobalt efflux system permease component RcnA